MDKYEIVRRVTSKVRLAIGLVQMLMALMLLEFAFT